MSFLLNITVMLDDLFMKWKMSIALDNGYVFDWLSFDYDSNSVKYEIGFNVAHKQANFLADLTECLINKVSSFSNKKTMFLRLLHQFSEESELVKTLDQINLPSHEQQQNFPKYYDHQNLPITGQ